MNGIEVRGMSLGPPVTVTSQSQCRLQCYNTPECTFFVHYTNGLCRLRRDFLAGPSGFNGAMAGVSATCIVRPNWGEFDVMKSIVVWPGAGQGMIRGHGQIVQNYESQSFLC